MFTRTARQFCTLLFLVTAAYASQSSAATFIVDATQDAPDINIGDGVCDSDPGAAVVCTLRAAINEANGSTAADTITVPAGVYRLTVPPSGSNNGDGEEGDLDIDRDLTINGAGPGRTIVDGTGWTGTDADRIFHLRLSGTDVTLSGMTITGGRFDGTGGAAIHNTAGGTVNIDNVLIRNINASGDGAILHQGSSAGSAVNILNITNTAFVHTYGSNTSALRQGYGSGAARTLVSNLENVTFASTTQGSLPNNRNGTVRVDDGTVNLLHTTFYRNRYGIDVDAGAVANIQNSLFVDNGDDLTGRNCRTDIQPVDATGAASGALVTGGSIVSLGGNYSSDPSCVTFIAGTDANAAGDPGLADMITDSGTVVVPFFSDSAITASAGCATGDQTLAARAAACVIGAYESTQPRPARLSAPAGAAGVVNGVVFRDYNDNGLREIGEPPISGVVVRAYGAAAAAIDNVTTDANGRYALNVAGESQVRVEFVNIPSYLEPTSVGPDSDTTVRFVSVPSANVDLGLFNPGQYCQSNPDLATSCYLFGDQASYPAGDTVVGFPYEARSESRSDGSVIGENGFGSSGNPTGPWAYTDPVPDHLAFGSQVGTTWGMAYHRTSGRLLVAAFTKRHAGFGPSGAGAIYSIDPTGASAPVPLLVLPDLTSDPHVTNAGDWAVDADAWDAVGRTSFGDMDISDDDSTLFVTNLQSRTLDVIDIASAARTAQVGIPDTLPGATTGCVASDVMPFAVGHNDGTTYVGLTCTATSTQDHTQLHAYVYEFDGAAFGAAPVLEFPFDYRRGAAFANDEYALQTNWRAWTPQAGTIAGQVPATMFDQEVVSSGTDNIRVAYPQPMLADIEFDDGDMVIAIMDRSGHQMGNAQKLPDGRTFADASEGTNIDTIDVVETVGDILRACASGAKQWTLESAASCGGTTTAGSRNLEGPGGGEFYFEDNFLAAHAEVLMGGIEQVPGTDDVVYSAYDPVLWNRDFNSGGIHWASNDYGSWQGGYRLYDTRTGGDTFAKANGLGDIEALCELAPIEIGNFVWLDSDNDGLQDPDEPAIAGVQIGLYDNSGVLIAIVETNSDGQYLFSSDPSRTDINGDADGVPEFDYGVPGLIPGENYTVAVLDSNFDPGGPLFGWTPTAGNTTADYRDSDGVTTAVGSGSDVASTGTALATGGAGANNHSYDFGFIAPRYDLALVKTLSPGQSAWILDGDVVSYSIRVRNQGNVSSGVFVVTDVIPFGMSYVSASGAGYACVHNPGSPPAIAAEVTCTYTPPTAADLAAGATAPLTVRLRADDLAQAPFLNWAEIESDSSTDYGVTDDDSDPGDHNGSDNGPGTGAGGSDPSIDHDDLSHSDVAYDDASEDEDDSDPVLVRTASTTPITLEFMTSSENPDGSIDVMWKTASEEANIGFRIYGRIAGVWQPLHDVIIPSTADDSHEAGQLYQQSFSTTDVDDLVIADIDVLGNEVIHGPFVVGKHFGRLASAVAQTNWTQLDAPDRVFDYSPVTSRSRVNVVISRTGIHRVTADDLLQRGIDWQGVRSEDIALSHAGVGIARFVTGGEYFNSNSAIEFVVETVPATRYSRDAHFELSLAPGLVKNIETVGSGQSRDDRRWATAGLARVVIERDRSYSRISPTDDPWWMDRLISLGNPVEKRYRIDLPRLVDGAGRISVDVWGGNDVLDINGDHTVRVFVNDIRVASARFDGINARRITGRVPAGLLKAQNNIVKLQVRSSGRDHADVVHVDRIEVHYPRRLRGDSKYSFNSSGDALRVDLTQGVSAAAYKRTEGEIYRLSTRTVQTAAGTRALALDDGRSGRVTIASNTSMVRPKLRHVAVARDLATGQFDYLVIAHPAFINEDLDRLIQDKESRGLTVRTVDVRAVYHQYGDGLASAAAIKEFVADAHQRAAIRYVLLVGDDSYDYRQNYRKRSRSFVPTLYGDAGSRVTQAPLDALFGDTDSDGVPDIAVGRFPVNSVSELRRMVDKTLQFSATGTSRPAAFIATDSVDDASRHSFRRDGEVLRRALGSGWSSAAAHVDVQGADRAGRQLVNRINKGVRMVGYIGHTSRKGWSFDGLFDQTGLGKLTNIGAPVVVTQFGCWNADYTTPNSSAISEALLVETDAGAAAVIGSTALAWIKSEAEFGAYLYQALGEGDLSLGDAMIKAKRRLADRRAPDAIKDILGAVVLLGDPSLVPFDRGE